MSGNSRPVLLIGGPRDGDYYALESALLNLNVVDMKRSNCQITDMDRMYTESRYQTHTYYRHAFCGEEFMIHETLVDNVNDFPRNVLAALKNGYKVIK